MACYYNFKVQFFVKLLIGDTERGFFLQREKEKKRGIYKERKRKGVGFTKRERDKEGDLQREKDNYSIKEKKDTAFLCSWRTPFLRNFKYYKKSGACESSNYTFRSHLRINNYDPGNNFIKVYD